MAKQNITLYDSYKTHLGLGMKEQTGKPNRKIQESTVVTS
jgi:hypothetical protein